MHIVYTMIWPERKAMFEKTHGSNMALPDQLYELRDKIKVLKQREEELAATIRQRGGERGDFVEAIVITKNQKRLDTEKVKAELGDRVDDFYLYGEVTQVLLRNIDPE